MKTPRNPFPIRELLGQAVDGAVAREGCSQTQIGEAVGLLRQNLSRVLHGDGTSSDAYIPRPDKIRALLGRCGYHVVLVADQERDPIDRAAVRALQADVLATMAKSASSPDFGGSSFRALMAVAERLDGILGVDACPRCGAGARAACILAEEHDSPHVGLEKAGGALVKWR